MQQLLRGRRRVVGLLLGIGLTATACSASASAGSGNLSISIVSPSDGASVTQPFDVKVDASVPLGDPSTGDHHVHLCFDGASCDSEYTLSYGDTIQVTGLTPGQHWIEASLRNADHSDAGASDKISVTVSGGGSGTGTSTGGSSGSSGGHGYGY
jgi:hypothetical protein